MPPAVRIDAGRLAAAVEHVADAAARGRIGPSGVAVATHDALLEARTFALPPGRGPDEDRLFAVASLTKPIVATAVLQLVEDGLLYLGAPLASYLPALAGGDKSGVTAWHLLTHTSGLPEIDWPDALRRRGTGETPLDVALRTPLEFRPGSRFLYSTLAFHLLGALVEQLTGEPWPAYVGRRILRPLAMTRSTFDPRADLDATVPVAGITAGEPVGAEEATDHWIALEMPGGGLWSTAGELAAFGQALLRTARSGSAEILGPAALALMARNHTDGVPDGAGDDASAVRHGLGWRLGWVGGARVLPGSDGVLEHAGATGGLLWIDPAWDLVVVFLASELGGSSTVRREVLQMVYAALRRPL